MVSFREPPGPPSPRSFCFISKIHPLSNPSPSLPSAPPTARLPRPLSVPYTGSTYAGPPKPTSV